jgi:hypothetical protein
VWVITSLLEIEQLWNKAAYSNQESGLLIWLLSPKTVESKACVSFLAASREAGRTKPQAHARVSGELMRGCMELRESGRRCCSGGLL